MKCSHTGLLAALVTGILAPALAPQARAEILLHTNTFRFTPGGGLVEEIRVDFHNPPGEEPPAEQPRINSFFIELTFDAADEGMTFTAPWHPLPSPARGVFALPGTTMVDEGSTPQRIRVSGALPEGESAPLTLDSVFAQFQVRVPQNYARDHFTVIVDPASRLTGPGGDIPFDPVGVGYDVANYVPEPAAGLLPLAGAFPLWRRRRRARAR